MRNVVVTQKLPEPVERRLSELYGAQLNQTERPFSREELIAAVRDADVLVSTLTDRIDASVLAEAGDRLKLIANFGAGVDHIDVQAAQKRGIFVSNTPGVLTEDTADMTMALILAVPRRFIEGERILERGEFRGWTPTWMLGRRISGKALGIIGMGRVGQAVARRARAFGLSIHYHNRRPVNPFVQEEFDATYWERLDAMLPRVDILSIHCPLTPSTHHLLSAERLDLLSPHAFVINTSRGEIIDEAALADRVSDGRIAGAGLDVFEREPEVNAKLLNAANVVLSPHMSSATLESRIEMGERVIINIQVFFDGHRPPDRVIPAFM